MRPHEAPLTLPASQRIASCRFQSAAWLSVWAMTLSSIAAMPIPTRISRVPLTPPLNESR